jgi:hypothetical protein
MQVYFRSTASVSLSGSLFAQDILVSMLHVIMTFTSDC